MSWRCRAPKVAFLKRDPPLDSEIVNALKKERAKITKHREAEIDAALTVLWGRKKGSKRERNRRRVPGFNGRKR